MPKTTVDLPEAVLAEAKGRAASERTTLRDVVETALRSYLAPQPAAGKYVLPEYLKVQDPLTAVEAHV
jgi:hypothetical protein